MTAIPTGTIELHDLVRGSINERTREILESRSTLPVVRRRGWLVRRALLAADVLGLSFAFALAEVLTTPGTGALPPLGEAALYLVSLPVWVVLAKLYGLYDRDEERTDHSTADDVLGVFHLVTVVTWLLFVVAQVMPVVDPTFEKLLGFWLTAVVAVPVLRGIARAYCRRQVIYLQNVLIVGADSVAQDLARQYLRHPEYGVNLVAFVALEETDLPPELEHIALLTSLEDLDTIIEICDVQRVLFAVDSRREEMVALARRVMSLDIQVDLIPPFQEVVGPGAGLHTVGGFPLLGLAPPKLSASSLLLKRLLDLALTSAALLVFAPVLVAVALWVKLDSRGSVLYRHKRVGRRGEPFEILKFRTMRREYCRGERYGGDVAELMFEQLMADRERREEFARTYKLQDDPRITRAGRFLRRTSLDELPQLFNVLRGDLSLVGPRAVTVAEESRYGDDWQTLLKIRPGVTGYWQINGRSALEYADRVRLDLAYISGWSLGLDLRILLKTIEVLLRGADAY